MYLYFFYFFFTTYTCALICSEGIVLHFRYSPSLFFLSFLNVMQWFVIPTVDLNFHTVSFYLICHKFILDSSHLQNTYLSISHFCPWVNIVQCKDCYFHSYMLDNLNYPRIRNFSIFIDVALSPATLLSKIIWLSKQMHRLILSTVSLQEVNEL